MTATEIIPRPTRTAEQEPQVTSRRPRFIDLQSEVFVIFLLAAAAFVAHGLNLFNAPGFHGDEGTYISRAWSILRDFDLSPYTYTFDHAPGGWILGAFWMLITGGPDTFGSSIFSGRILVLIIHVASVPFMYRITRKLGCSVGWAAFGTALFSLSPLALTYQRMFLLDNLLIFWVLLSIDLLLDGWGRMSRQVSSGIIFGIAILTKETAIFLIPAMLYIAFRQRWEHQGQFGLAVWLVPMLTAMSWYPLFAALKGELLPAGGADAVSSLSREPGGRVSLIDALRWQVTRSGGGPFDLGNMFWHLVRNEWFPRDPVLLVGGALASIRSLFVGRRDRRALAAGLLGVLPLIYLAKGGVVFDFYIVFAIPFFALNLAIVADGLRRPSYTLKFAVTLAVIASLVFGFGSRHFEWLFVDKPASANVEAVKWIKKNIPSKSRIVAGDEFLVDLREPSEGRAFPNVHSHWKVASDPEVRDVVFKNNWQSVHYVLLSKGMRDVLNDSGNKVTLEALKNSGLIRTWSRDRNRIELWKVGETSTQKDLLTETHHSIAERFEREGAVRDKDGIVTSEAQAYFLLRAAWIGDGEGFRRVWSWTKSNLQRDDALLSWKWRDGEVIDENTATDADTDAALALLYASKRFRNPGYRADGAKIASAIFEHEVAVVGRKPILTAGNWWKGADVIPVNPSYIAPYAYRVFAEVDKKHDWYSLVDSSYELLDQATSASLGDGKSVGIPPDWVGADLSDGTLVPINLEGRETANYGYDAPRMWWRVALDLRYTGDERAEALLRRSDFLLKEVNEKGTVAAVYGRDGSVKEEVPSKVGIAAAAAALKSTAPDKSESLFSTFILGDLRRDDRGTHWSPSDDLYTQEWAWFAVGFQSEVLHNIWFVPRAVDD